MLQRKLYLSLAPLLAVLILTTAFLIYQQRDEARAADTIRENIAAKLVLATEIEQITETLLENVEAEPEQLTGPLNALADRIRGMDSAIGERGRRVLSAFNRTHFNEEVARATASDLRHEAFQSRERLLLELEEILDARSQSNTATEAVLIFAIVAVSVMTVFIVQQIAQRIAAPLEDLATRAESLAAGNWDTVIRPMPRGPFHRISSALSHLVLELREYRRLNERKINASRRRTETFVENDPDPIVFCDLSGHITSWNPRAQALIEAFEEKELPEELRVYLDRSIEEEGPVEEDDLREAYFINIDGKRHYYLPHCFPLRSETGDTDQIACALREVTRLRLADDLRSNLLATVSHEIKTPLTSAQMSLALLEEDPKLNVADNQRDLLETASKDLGRILHLLQNTLNFSRFESGAHDLELTTLPADEVAEQAYGILQREAEMHGHRLLLRSERDLPLIEIDVERIIIVLSCLLNNAVRVSPEGAPLIFYCTHDSGDVRMGLLDEGPGLPKESPSRLFERFYRATSRRGNSATAGLGLSIAREIVVAHSGHINARNREEKGADFFFVLPAATKESEDAHDDSNEIPTQKSRS